VCRSWRERERIAGVREERCDSARKRESDRKKVERTEEVKAEENERRAA